MRCSQQFILLSSSRSTIKYEETKQNLFNPSINLRKQRVDWIVIQFKDVNKSLPSIADIDLRNSEDLQTSILGGSVTSLHYCQPIVFIVYLYTLVNFTITTI